MLDICKRFQFDDICNFTILLETSHKFKQFIWQEENKTFWIPNVGKKAVYVSFQLWEHHKVGSKVKVNVPKTISLYLLYYSISWFPLPKELSPNTIWVCIITCLAYFRALRAWRGNLPYVPTCFTCSRVLRTCIPSCLCFLRSFIFLRVLCTFIFLRPVPSFIYVSSFL